MGGIRRVALSSTIVLLVSCSGAEQQVVKTFLTAVQGGDETTLSGVSLVKFPGSVTSWEILEVGPESSEPFPLADVRKELVELETKIKFQQERHANFLSDNAEKAAEYKRRIQRNPDYQFSGEMADFKENVDALTEERKELEATLEELRQRISGLQNAAALSLNTSVNHNFEGEVKGKIVRLKVNDGSQEKIFSLFLRRYELSDKERNLTPMSRWIIADIEEQA
jgi:hypothetical protein